MLLKIHPGPQAPTIMRAQLDESRRDRFFEPGLGRKSQSNVRS